MHVYITLVYWKGRENTQASETVSYSATNQRNDEWF